MSHLLDANVFIQAKNLHYGLWSSARRSAIGWWSGDASRAFSIDKVAGNSLSAGLTPVSDPPPVCHI